MIHVAKVCGADAIKLQLFKANKLYQMIQKCASCLNQLNLIHLG